METTIMIIGFTLTAWAFIFTVRWVNRQVKDIRDINYQNFLHLRKRTDDQIEHNETIRCSHISRFEHIEKQLNKLKPQTLEVAIYCDAEPLIQELKRAKRIEFIRKHCQGNRNKNYKT